MVSLRRQFVKVHACLSLPSTADSRLHLRLLFPISLIRGSFSHSDSSPHLSCPLPGHPPLYQGCFPFQCLQPAAWSVPQQKGSSESGSFYFSIFFLSSLSRFTIDMFSHESAPLPLLSCSHFLDLSKILPTLVF